MNKGNSADGRLPKFFKVYLPNDSGDDLAIPISFNSYLPKSLPKTVIVRSIYGNVWKLELRKCGGETVRVVMVNGWKRIVKDEVLSGGEFLVFEFDGSRLFSFCIYGHATCKRLKSLVQTNEMKDDSDGGDGSSSDDIIVLDNDADGNDVQANEDKEKARENIIVLDDEDDSKKGDDATNVGDVQDGGDENGSNKDIIVLDDDTDEDYGSSRDSKKSDNEVGRPYLDNDMNPFFIVNHNMQRDTNLSIPARVIKDYNLRFPEVIYVIDPLGKLKRKVEDYTIKEFESIIRRNQVKPNDKMICELEKEMNGLVCVIKIHIISG